MITKNYIKMCEGAIEIQTLWKHKKKDNYVKNTQGLRLLTWLPTQEQLFGILWQAEKSKLDYSYSIAKHHEQYILQVGIYNTEDSILAEYGGESIQECLLQRIYNYKYDKVWDGEKWNLH